MDEIRYPVLIHDDLSGLRVEIPNFDFSASGSSLQECLAVARECLDRRIGDGAARGCPLPRPSNRSGTNVFLVAPSPRLQAGLLLRFAREELGLTQAELARRLGIAQRTYSGMENPGRTNLTLRKLAELAAGLGKRVVIRFEDLGRPRMRIG
jgi:antitoxin HicB